MPFCKSPASDAWRERRGPTPSGGELDLPPGATVAGPLRALRVEPLHQARIACFVNDERARPARVLADGDRVYLQVPISGG